MPGLFITATGTDIGKTYVAAGLLRAARRAGLAVAALKPVLSGYEPTTMATSDAGVLLAALDRPITTAMIAAISPWRFAAPLSPDMAAAAEGREIDVAAVTANCRAAITAEALTLIEGVGGIMVPLDDRHTTLDMMATLALPVVLVTGSYLGAISHGLTAIAALAARGIAPALVILNETAGSPVHSTRRSGRCDASARPRVRDPFARIPRPGVRRSAGADPPDRSLFTRARNCA